MPQCNRRQITKGDLRRPSCHNLSCYTNLSYERIAYGVLGGVSVAVPSAGGGVDVSDVVVEVSVVLEAAVEVDVEASAAGVLASAGVEVSVSAVLAQAASSNVANANNAREAWRTCVFRACIFMAFSLAS